MTRRTADQRLTRKMYWPSSSQISGTTWQHQPSPRWEGTCTHHLIQARRGAKPTIQRGHHGRFHLGRDWSRRPTTPMEARRLGRSVMKPDPGRRHRAAMNRATRRFLSLPESVPISLLWAALAIRSCSLSSAPPAHADLEQKRHEYKASVCLSRRKTKGSAEIPEMSFTHRFIHSGNETC